MGIFDATPEEADGIMQDGPASRPACSPMSFTPVGGFPISSLP
jgi:hypothetical protein